MIKNVCGEHHRNQTKKGTEKRINAMSSKIISWGSTALLYIISKEQQNEHIYMQVYAYTYVCMNIYECSSRICSNYTKSVNSTEGNNISLE